MIETLKNAFKIKDIRNRILFTFFILVVVRAGCQFPVPGVNHDVVSNFMSSNTGDAFNFFNAITGGSFAEFALFALNITPYITASIIMQLLTIAIPKLEELQKDGEDGRKIIAQITRYVTVALALIESIAMSIGFRNQGLFKNDNWQSIVLCVATLTAGSAVLMWLGERITEKGIGNGISIVLTINIISSLPGDLMTVYERFVQSASIAMKVVSVIVILALMVAMVVFTVLLQEAQRKIPVQYAKKMQGRKMMGGQSSHIPLKVNTAGVIPVIFASSILSFPVVIAQFFNVDYSTIGGKILLTLNSSNWCRPEQPIYSIGFLIYAVLIILFAYFYTSITFNPVEVATNMKKQGGFILGVRPGKPTSEYLTRILNYIILIGAIGLLIVCAVPIIISGVFNVSRLSFLGTSLIIIVGVVLETLKQIESLMAVRSYRGFLNNM
ncbi:Preprotein translocase secY subunit [Lachnospiraceae bacterium TWA4]|nr:Preprotein translocase secY subunit [Lachnospiraceae bacterium TWA4]